MATFLTAFIGFVVTLFVVVSPVEAQHRSDPGRPTVVRSKRAPTVRLFRAGTNTGYMEMIEYINARRPAGQGLTPEQFEAANEGRVTYVCVRRRGERPLRRRNGVFPLVNRTTEPIRWETFCPDGRRRHELANGMYFREPVPGRTPLSPRVPQEQGAPDTSTSQAEEPAQAFAATAAPPERPQPPILPPTAPAPVPPAPPAGEGRTTSSAEFHAQESAIRELSSHAAIALLLLGIGVLGTYLLMRQQNNRLSKQLQALQQAWSSNGEGVLEPARLNEVLWDGLLHETVLAEWAKRFPSLPFEEQSFKKLILRTEAQAETDRQLREAKALHNRQQRDARDTYHEELERLRAASAASSSAGRTSTTTIGPPRLGTEKANGQKPPSLPPDAGMGADPFPEPTPDQG